MQTNIADTILNIAITGNLVRLNLDTVTPIQAKDCKQEHRAAPIQQVIMLMKRFVRAIGIQEQIIKKLNTDGELKSQPAPERPVNVTTGTPPTK